MSRLTECFDEARAAGRCLLIPFLMAADPVPEATVPLMQAAVEGGADIIEIGIPFSDPMADGPVIQKAHERALRHGMTLARVLAAVAEFRRLDPRTPVVVMGYVNPIESLGHEEFARRAASAGVDGVIVVDLPVEESRALNGALASHGLDLVFLLAPTTGLDRAARIAAEARGFLYYVSIKGVTGAARHDFAEPAARIASLRAVTALPVGIGFGIADPEAASAAAAAADAVVVGSALVERIGQAGETAAAVRVTRAFVRSLREGVDSRVPQGARS